MTDELKPVPCGCGGKAKVVKHEYYMCSPTYGVTCYKCGTATNQGFDTEAEAVTAWNRAMGERTAKVEAVEKPIIGDTEGKTIKVTSCGNCKNTVSIFDNFCPGCGCRLIWGDEHE